jgi:hypothetical protein
MAIPQNGGSRAQQVINIGSADYSLFRWIAPDEVPICTKSCPFGVKSAVLTVGRSLPFYPGGLNRSTQHFILEGKDGVWDGTEIS